MSLWDFEDSHSRQDTPRPAQEPAAEEASALELQMKVDFFRKLGYSSLEIHSVLQKLGIQADTNTVLGELVKHGMATERERQVSPDPCPQLPLVPRGGGTPKAPNLEPPLPEEDKEGSDLRPVVIDGSNVAMSTVSLLLSAELCRDQLVDGSSLTPLNLISPAQPLCPRMTSRLGPALPERWAGGLMLWPQVNCDLDPHGFS
ncbi:hypothetical protein P7K49_015988 [Saguinus oedipus]|uniref:Rege-1 UBA-like domain-containing protein n=1 Tax=Saguinus oedipus TaxID=9490 RepID=A0ABQ9VAT0_SAGOE|nr:hypothetical protein P7K49_015988 [Saguinus oedipus]